MRDKLTHIAVIPARKNSKSLPYKNRFLFKYTAKFLKNNKLFNKIYVNSDDPHLKILAKKYGFDFFNRQQKLARDTTCIKKVFIDMNNKLNFPKNTYIWLFYIPLVYKNKTDFKKAIKLVEQKRLKSICSFIPAKTHPMSCWQVKKNKVSQFIKNDLCRRQDFPKAYSHHHYICGFNPKYLNKLNNELIFKNTFPMLLNKNTTKKLMEIDTPEEYKKFQKVKQNEKTKN